MASFGTRSAIFWLLHITLLLLLLVPVRCDDEEDHLLSGINSFRQSSNVPALAKHDKADCLAGKIADKLEDQPCASNNAPTIQSQISNYQDLLKKCDIDINTTRDGVIIPVCVPKRVATLVLTNYTQSQNSRYLNNSKYTGVGIGTEDDWTVVVLTTTTPGGSFASRATRLLGVHAMSYLFTSLVFGSFLLLVI